MHSPTHAHTGIHTPTHAHTHTDCSIQSLGRFGPEPLRCRGDWAAWGSQTMFASTSGWFALALTPFISPSLCLSLSRLSLSPSGIYFLCSSSPFPPLLLFMHCLPYSFCAPSVPLTHLLYLTRSSVRLPPLFQHTHTHSRSPSILLSLTGKLSFFPHSPFKQQKAISLPLSGGWL